MEEGEISGKESIHTLFLKAIERDKWEKSNHTKDEMKGL
jgi:hypothetical protein